MKSQMKLAIGTTALIFLVGSIASANAQQEEHKQEGKQEQQQGRPAQQQRQAEPAARQQTRSPEPAQQQRQAQPAARNRQGAASQDSSNAHSKATLVGTTHRRRRHTLRLETEVIPNMAAFPTTITRPALAASTVST